MPFADLIHAPYYATWRVYMSWEFSVTEWNLCGYLRFLFTYMGECSAPIARATG